MKSAKNDRQKRFAIESGFRVLKLKYEQSGNWVKADEQNVVSGIHEQNVNETYNSLT